MAVDFNHELVGRKVAYRGHHTNAEPEEGEVSSVNVEAGIVFVKYRLGGTPQATDWRDLEDMRGRKLEKL